jgi:pyruvate formate lyase activating enzyme
MSLNVLPKCCLMSLDRYGEDKYSYLGRDYTMSHIETPTDDKMEILKSVVEACGLKCQIGG